MKTTPNSNAIANESYASKVARVKAALEALQPQPKHENTELISDVYEVLVRKMGQKVTRRDILKKLNEIGIKLHPAKFKELFDIEKAKRQSQSAADAAAHQNGSDE